MSRYFDGKELFTEPQVTQYGSHMVMTNVHKHNKKKYINMDTKFRDNYDHSTLQYTISIPERINDVKSLKIMNIEIPMTFYNISTTFQNTVFEITNVNTDKNLIVTIPNNQYTNNTIIDAINLIISPVFPDLSIGITGTSVFFTTTSNNQYKITFDINTDGTLKPTNIRFNLGWILGFRNVSYTFYHSLYAESFIDLSGPRYLFLVLDEFVNGNPNSFISPISNSFITRNIIARITLDNKVYPYGSILPALTGQSILSDTRTYCGKINLQRFQFQLLTDNGFQVDLNGLDFSFLMMVEHE
jgi:hypothetical protein